MARRSCGRAPARAQRAPARTSSPGVASTLLASRGAELGLFEVDEAALPEVARRVRPRAIALGNLFRDQLDRYGELELVAERWRAAVAVAARRRCSSSTPTTRCSASSRAGAASGCSRSASTTRGTRAPALQHAADSTLLRRCGTPYDYAAAYVGHLGDYRCPHCGTPRACRSTSPRARSSCTGSTGARSRSSRPPASARVELALPGLYNVYNAVAAAALATALGVPLDEIAAGLERFVGRVRPLRADRGRRPAAADAADQEPRRRERGGADAARRRRPTPRGGRAERRDRRRPRRLVDLGRRLRAAARRARPRRRVGRARRRAGAALRLRRPRRATGSRSCPTSSRRSTAASS